MLNDIITQKKDKFDGINFHESQYGQLITKLTGEKAKCKNIDDIDLFDKLTEKLKQQHTDVMKSRKAKKRKNKKSFDENQIDVNQCQVEFSKVMDTFIKSGESIVYLGHLIILARTATKL